MVPSVPQPGDLVAGKYEVSRLLGKGGMGVVVEAVHRKLGTRVAIKFLMPDALTTHDGVARFDREARAAALLRSPHVVRVLDVDTTSDGLPFIVMEYLDGHDLGSELRKRKVIPVAEAVDWILEASIGLAEAHAYGIVHRDIKPANLHVCEEGGRPIVKVMDFGVSKLLASKGEVDLTTADTTVGTPSYMAPEQLLSSKTLDHRVDVWALGVVLYRMLGGALPFVGGTPTALAIAIASEPPTPLATLAPSLPPELLGAVMRSLEKDASRRFPDVVAFGRALQPFGTGRVAFHAAVAGIPAPLALGADAPPRVARPEAATVPFVRGAPNVTVPMAPAFAAAPTPARAPMTATASAPSGSRSKAVALACALLLLLVVGAAVAVSLRRSSAASLASSPASPPASSIAATVAGGAFAPPPSVAEPGAESESTAPSASPGASGPAPPAPVAGHVSTPARTSNGHGAGVRTGTVPSGVAHPPAVAAPPTAAPDPTHL